MGSRGKISKNSLIEVGGKFLRFPLHFIKGFTWPKFFQPVYYLEFENLKEQSRQPKIWLKIEFGSIHPSGPEESGSENFIANLQN